MVWLSKYPSEEISSELICQDLDPLLTDKSKPSSSSPPQTSRWGFISKLQCTAVLFVLIFILSWLSPLLMPIQRLMFPTIPTDTHISHYTPGLKTEGRKSQAICWQTETWKELQSAVLEFLIWELLCSPEKGSWTS